MAKQRATRPEKRHLVRWTDDMDKKLLLTIQSECNAQNITLPWTDIGHTMDENITGGAVIQHLAKLRNRMVDQGLAVPPPLRRGGVSRISTGPSLPRRRSSVPKSPSSGIKDKKSINNAKKRRAATDEESGASDENTLDTDSDAEYGKVGKREKVAKRKRPNPKIKAEDDDWEDEEAISKDVDVKEKVGDEVDDRVVATGASFLALEKGAPLKGQVSRKTKAKPSLIVSLAVRKDGRAYIKKESPGKPECSHDSSDEEPDDEDLDEENANSASTKMSSKGQAHINTVSSKSSQASDFSGPNSDGSTTRALVANSPHFGPYSNMAFQSGSGDSLMTRSITSDISGLPMFIDPTHVNKYYDSGVSDQRSPSSILDNGQNLSWGGGGDSAELRGGEYGVPIYQPPYSNLSYDNSIHGAQYSHAGQYQRPSLPQLSTSNQQVASSQGRDTSCTHTQSSVEETPTSDVPENVFRGSTLNRGPDEWSSFMQDGEFSPGFF